MQKASIVLSLASGVLFAIAYCDYLRAIHTSTARPSRASWFIFALIGVLNLGTYLGVTDDVWKSVLPITNIGFGIAVFVFTLIVGERKKLKFSEWLTLSLGLATIVVWKYYGSASYANVIVQGAIFVGFFSTWGGIWHDPMAEMPRPWKLWTCCYMMALAVVLLRWKGQPLELLYPINCAILHISVPILCWLRSKAEVPRSILELRLLQAQEDIHSARRRSDFRSMRQFQELARRIGLRLGHKVG